LLSTTMTQTNGGTMQIEIKNYRGCQSAAFALEQITLIGGGNAVGKSSITQAVGGVLTGNPLPLRGVSKNSAGQLVRSGTAAGSVELIQGDSSTEITWPNAKVKTTGTPPQATEYAVGLSCVLNLPAKDRSAALAQYLKAEPTREDFDKGLASLDLPADLLDQLWQGIEATGWDGALKNVKEKGARLKGQWEQITGQRYGSKKADNYIPDGWEPELDGLSGEALEADLNDARQLLEAAIAADAIDDSKRAELEEQADQITGLKEQIATLEAEVDEAQQKRDAARKELQALPRAEQASPLTCPCCEKPLLFEGGALVKAKPLSADEVWQRQQAISDMQDECDEAQIEFENAQNVLNDHRNKLHQAQKASKELEQMQQAPDDAGDIDQAREQVNHCESRLHAWKQKTEADGRHMNIGINAELAKQLAPDGIRRQKLVAALETVNGGMARMSEASGFGVVALDDELSASLNGTPYHLLSKSERWRVRVTLQLWMASADGSAAVIIDGADILADRELRNGLFAVLQAIDKPALVTMALADSDLLPDLAAAGLGASYWVKNGVMVAK